MTIEKARKVIGLNIHNLDERMQMAVATIMDAVEKKEAWKPSDEQMEALESAVKLYKDTHYEKYHDRIVSLYEHLKKL